MNKKDCIRNIYSVSQVLFHTVWLLITLAITGCGDSSKASAGSTLTQSKPVRLPPIKVALFFDKSGSSGKNRVAQTDPQYLEPLIEVLRRNGGELRLGLITDESNHTLVPLRIDSPPLPPEKPPAEGNVFEEVERVSAYQKRVAEFESKKIAWQEKTDVQIRSFFQEVGPLLEKAPNARRSDVFGALHRAELFLSEPDLGWSQPTLRYVVLVSDGEDNVKKKFEGFKSGAQLLLINGAGTVGSLEYQKPIRFESIDAAFRFIDQSSKS